MKVKYFLLVGLMTIAMSCREIEEQVETNEIIEIKNENTNPILKDDKKKVPVLDVKK